jgi:hypothetical protein
LEIKGGNILESMDIDIEGLDEAISSETETAMAADFNLDESAIDLDKLELGDITDSEPALDEIAIDEEPVAESSIVEEPVVEEQPAVSSDDSLEDILSMLDDDSELAEINDMLQKSDNNEPVKDDVMDLLNQMADDEAQSVNSGVVDEDTDEDDDDGGVPLPKYNAAQVNVQDLDDDEDEDVIEEEIPAMAIDNDLSSTNGASTDVVDADDDEDDDDDEIEYQEIEPEEPKKSKGKKKDSKSDEPKKEKWEKAKKSKKKKKEKSSEDSENGEKKGFFGKLFDVLTQDLVPEPTEEELAAEKEAKEAKKAENLSKKDEAKQAKAEAKQAKAEEKEAAKKAKAEETAKKKREKAEANKAKKEAKDAKKAELAASNKKIPKKNIMAAALFAASVFVAVMIATTILSHQGYLRAARKAFYNEDYMTVYEDTYGMDLDTSNSDGLIKARSEVILKLERRYDSYQTNVKMGREMEALDALIQGLATYDYINAEAEQYNVLTEVDEIKDNIVNTLQTRYGIDESEARQIMSEEDSTAYTLDLKNVISQ